MDTIKNYFDNLFMALPSTQEVEKAKEELLSFAEDRYHELKGQGKGENEAVGIVIEEFGNIDELALELGVDAYQKRNPQERIVTQKIAEQFCAVYEKADFHLGLGIFLLYISPCMLIFLGLLNSRRVWYDAFSYVVSPALIACAGVSFLLACIALGLCFVIYSSFSRRPFRFMERERFVMDYSTRVYVSERHEQQQTKFVFRIMVAVTLLVIGVIPLVFMGVFYDAVPVAIRGIAVDAFMVMYGLSIFLFILAGMSQKRFKILGETGRFAHKRYPRP